MKCSLHYLSLLLLLLLELTGCRGSASGSPPGTSESEIQPGPEESAESSDRFAANTSDPADFAAGYLKAYPGARIYPDLLVPGKALLIADDVLEELFCTQAYHRETTMKKAAVERIARNDYPSFSTVEIFDKTGQCLSVSVDPAAAAEIVELIWQACP